MIRIFVIAIAMLSFVSVANAQRTPRQFLGDLVKQAETIQSIETTPQRINGLVLTLVLHNFDTERMGKFVLGRHWRKATFNQKERFLKAFEIISVQRFSPILRDLPFDTFRIISVNDEDYNNVMVVSTIVKDGKTIKIQWRLRSDYFPEYQVIDITAEGISLMLTLRAEYGSAIKQDGIEKVISRLENGIQENKTRKR